MNVTHESTGLDDANRERREGSVLWGKTKALLDELESLRAKVERLTPNDAHARNCKTQQKERLVLLALDNDRLRLEVMNATWCRRTKIVRDHLREFKERYGIEKPPTCDTVKKVLIKHGYM